MLRRSCGRSIGPFTRKLPYEEGNLADFFRGWIERAIIGQSAGFRLPGLSWLPCANGHNASFSDFTTSVP